MYVCKICVDNIDRATDVSKNISTELRK